MKKDNLILKIIVGVIFVLAVVGMFMIGSASSAVDAVKANQDATSEMIASADAQMASATSFVVILSLVLLAIAAAAAVGTSVVTMIKQPAALKKTLLGVGIFVVLLVVSYVLASDAQVFGSSHNALILGSTEDIAKVSKWSGTGLILSYILLAVGGIGFVGDLLKNLIKS